jgi:hypothetical protein
MQHTFQIKSGSLNAHFLESVRAIFGDREIKIVIEDVEKTRPLSQKELYKKSLPIIERFKNVKVDPKLDLSALANEVNL